MQDMSRVQDSIFFFKLFINVFIYFTLQPELGTCRVCFQTAIIKQFACIPTWRKRSSQLFQMLAAELSGLSRGSEGLLNSEQHKQLDFRKPESHNMMRDACRAQLSDGRASRPALAYCIMRMVETDVKTYLYFRKKLLLCWTYTTFDDGNSIIYCWLPFKVRTRGISGEGKTTPT